MFRGTSGETRLSAGESASSPTGHGVASPGLYSQESSWIGVLSRPALSFLQRYLPGRPRPAALQEKGLDWISGELKTSLVHEGSGFFRELDDMKPLPEPAAPHLPSPRGQPDGACGLLEPGGGSSLPWLTADSLRVMGIQSSQDGDLNLCQQTQIGYLSSARTFLSQVWLSSVSSQEINPPGGKDWGTGAARTRGGKSQTWWGSFWGGEESSQKGLLSDVSWATEGTETSCLCPQQPTAETKDPAAQTTEAFVQSPENTGPTDHKDQPANNGGLPTVQNREGSTADPQLSISDHLSRSGAATACSEVALLTPDQDNGYSSLEEEHFQTAHLCLVKALSEELPQPEAELTEPGSAVRADMEEETSGEGRSASGAVEEEEGKLEDEEEDEQEAAAPEATVLHAPQCQNKTIAFIMGCPCSDDDSSQSDGESSDDDDDDDDDGFDSEGSSDLSDSSDEDDDEQSDSEEDSEAVRLWRSLCQSVDPYNPQNFTARLRTSSTPPRAIPTSTPPSSNQSTPASSPDLTPLPPSLPTASPPSGLDVWEDSTSASEVDEAESLRLWSSFSCSSDPYSPLNFQAPVRTRERVEPAPRARAKARKALQPHQSPASPPEYRKEEAEERLDSGFSEPSTSSRSCSSTKKVRFCDDVEEFFASCGEEEEDRRGPWEELARDRCRFLRRCQEVEQSIAYCLQPQHRRRVYRRLTAVLNLQDA